MLVEYRESGLTSSLVEIGDLILWLDFFTIQLNLHVAKGDGRLRLEEASLKDLWNSCISTDGPYGGNGRP